MMHFITKSIWVIIIFLLPLQASVELILEGDSLLLGSSEEIEPILQERIYELARTGYPFARWHLTSYNERAGREAFKYRIDRGSFSEIDSVIYGDLSKNEHQMLEFFGGEDLKGVFDIRKIESAAASLQLLEHIMGPAAPQIDGSTLYLPVEVIEDARISGILNIRREDRVEILGELQVDLMNFTSLGRHLGFYWSHPDVSSHDLRLDAGASFLFGRPVSLDLSFAQNFRDSLYIMRDNYISASYYLNPEIRFGAHYSREAVSANQSREILDYQKEDYSSSGLNFALSRGKGRSRYEMDLGLGRRKSELREINYADLHLNAGIDAGVFSPSLRVRAGFQDSDRDIPTYFQYKFGSAELLPAEHYDQHRTPSYLCAGLEVGSKAGINGGAIFFQHARLAAPQRRIINFGLILRLVTARRGLELILAFNPEYSWEAGRLYLIWEL